MFKRMGKRGNEDKLYFSIWEILVLAMVFIALLVAVRGIATNNSYWKKYHAIDLALISDLESTNQGDFVVNYNFKSMEDSTTSKLLGIGMLFGTLLTKNGIFVYDTSNPGNEDRFPQSWAIARSKNINIQENDITSKFAILYKIGDILSIKDYYDVPENSCPGIDTADDIKNLKFNSITLASDSGNTMQDYASQIGIMLGLYGTSGSSNGWLIIMHKSDSAGSTGIYYTKDRPLQGEKLGCLIIRQLSEKYPDIKVSSTLADDAMGKEVLDKISNTNELKGYNLWIIIQLSEEDSQSIDQSALSSLVKDALGEYYGSKTQG